MKKKSVHISIEENENIFVLKTSFGEISYSGDIGALISIKKRQDDLQILNNLFLLPNMYLETLPVEVNEKLFKEFYNIKQYIDRLTEIDIEDVFQKVSNSLYVATRLIEYEGFRKFVFDNQHLIKVHETIQDKFIEDRNKQTLREKTYVRDEFIGLVALVCYARMFLPIYADLSNFLKHKRNGDDIDSTLKTRRSSKGNNFHYKLLLCFENTCFVDTEDYKKLEEYITVNVTDLMKTTKRNSYLIQDGFSMEDVVDNFIAETIFDKLFQRDFTTDDAKLVSFIFNNIRSKISGNESYDRTIRSKKSPSENSEDDTSYFEDYRRVTDITIGNIAEIQIALENIEQIAEAIKMTDFNYSSYKDKLEDVKNDIYSIKYTDVQLILLGYILDRYINIRSLYYIENRRLAELMFLAKELLEFRGFKILPVIFISQKYESEASMISDFYDDNFKEVMKHVGKHYSFIYETGGKKNKKSMLEETYSRIFSEIINSEWRVVLPVDNPYVDDDGRLHVGPEIKNELLNFVKLINE